MMTLRQATVKGSAFSSPALYSGRCTLALDFAMTREADDGGGGKSWGMTYELVLIRSDCRENRLRENKRPELFRLQIADSDVR